MNENDNQKWYSGIAPWQMSEDDFVALHRTGFISSDTYENYGKTGGLSWLGNKQKYPIVQCTVGEVEYLRSGSKLKYVRTDESNEIVRGPDGLATYLSETEAKQTGYATHDQTIVAFVGDEPVGLVSNEWGAVGVWVEERC